MQAFIYFPSALIHEAENYKLFMEHFATHFHMNKNASTQGINHLIPCDAGIQIS